MMGSSGAARRQRSKSLGALLLSTAIFAASQECFTGGTAPQRFLSRGELEHGGSSSRVLMRARTNRKHGGFPVKLKPRNFLKKNRRKYIGHNANALTYIKKVVRQGRSGVEPLGTTQVPELNLERKDEDPLDLLRVEEWPGRRLEAELEEEELADRSPSGFLITDEGLGVTELEREVIEAIVNDDADQARQIILEGANMVPVLVRILQRDDIDPKWVSWLIGMGVDRKLMLNGSSCLPVAIAGGTRTTTDENLPARLRKLQRLEEADFDFGLVDGAGETAFHKLVHVAEEQIHKAAQAELEAGPFMASKKAAAKRQLAMMKKQEVLQRLAEIWAKLTQLRPAPTDANSLSRNRTPEFLGHVESVMRKAGMIVAR